MQTTTQTILDELKNHIKTQKKHIKSIQNIKYKKAYTNLEVAEIILDDRINTLQHVRKALDEHFKKIEEIERRKNDNKNNQTMG